MAVLIICIVSGLIVVKFFYFSPERATPSTNSNLAGQTNFSEYQIIKRELLDNKIFNGLKKTGGWPIDPSQFKKDKETPFVKEKVEGKNIIQKND